MDGRRFRVWCAVGEVMIDGVAVRPCHRHSVLSAPQLHPDVVPRRQINRKPYPAWSGVAGGCDWSVFGHLLRRGAGYTGSPKNAVQRSGWIRPGLICPPRSTTPVFRRFNIRVNGAPRNRKVSLLVRAPRRASETPQRRPNAAGKDPRRHQLGRAAYGGTPTPATHTDAGGLADGHLHHRRIMAEQLHSSVHPRDALGLHPRMHFVPARESFP